MNIIKQIKRHRFFLIFVLLGPLPLFFASAQTPDFEQSWNTADQWRKEGQLVTIQISKGNPLRIFVVGKEEAKFDLSSLNLTIRRIKPYPGKTLSVNKMNNYFVVPDSSDFQQAQEIEIMAKVKDKNETFRFELKKDKP